MSFVLLFLSITLYAILSALYFRFYLWGRFLLNPAGIFYIYNTRMFLGTVFLLDLENGHDQIHMAVLVLSFTSLVLGSFFANVIFPVSRSRARNWWSSEIIYDDSFFRFVSFFALMLISVFIVILYFKAIGYNLFSQMLFGSLQSGDDIAGMRLAAYAGEEYYAPGYVNQFKNIILPLLSIFFLYYGAYKGNLKVKALGVVGLGVSIFGLLGTGQRGAFFIFFIIFFVFYISSLSNENRRGVRVLFRGRLMLVGLASFSVLLAVSYGLGRGAEDGNMLFSILRSMADRFFFVNQNASIIAFRYIYDQPTAWGSQWVASLAGVLPGYKGSDLNNIIFSLIWGSYRGNSPPSLYGSLFYNFSWLGVFIGPFVIGLFYHLVYRFLFKGDKTISRLIFYSAYAVILGFWSAGSPVYLLNKGMMAVFLLVVLDRLLVVRNGRSRVKYQRIR